MPIEANQITSEHMAGRGKVLRPKGLVVFHGAAGSGKGTSAGEVAAQMTAKGINTVHFPSGDSLRTVYDTDSTDPIEQELAKIAAFAQPYMDRGDLVPVDEMTQLITLRLHQINENQNADEILLDGFPRSRFQDLALRRISGPEYVRRDIFIDALRPTAKARAEKRARDDDTPEGIARRMHIFYEDETDKNGILQMIYKIKMDIDDGILDSKFHRIDAAQSPEAVQAEALNFILETSPVSGLSIPKRRHRVHGQYTNGNNNAH